MLRMSKKEERILWDEEYDFDGCFCSGKMLSFVRTVVGLHVF
jgi:hypothetical protein